MSEGGLALTERRPGKGFGDFGGRRNNQRSKKKQGEKRKGQRGTKGKPTAVKGRQWERGNRIRGGREQKKK